MRKGTIISPNRPYEKGLAETKTAYFNPQDSIPNKPVEAGCHERRFQREQMQQVFKQVSEEVKVDRPVDAIVSPVVE